MELHLCYHLIVERPPGHKLSLKETKKQRNKEQSYKEQRYKEQSYKE